MIILCYYFLYFLVEAWDDTPGFFIGRSDGVILRYLILIFTFYLGAIEIIMLTSIKEKVFASYYFMSNVFMLVFNMTIVVMHASLQTDMHTLSLLSSVAVILLWF